MIIYRLKRGVYTYVSEYILHLVVFNTLAMILMLYLVLVQKPFNAVGNKPSIVLDLSGVGGREKVE